MLSLPHYFSNQSINMPDLSHAERELRDVRFALERQRSCTSLTITDSDLAVPTSGPKRGISRSQSQKLLQEIGTERRGSFSRERSFNRGNPTVPRRQSLPCAERRRSSGSTPTLLEENCAFVAWATEHSESDSRVDGEMEPTTENQKMKQENKDLMTIRELCRMLAIPKQKGSKTPARGPLSRRPNCDF